MPPLEAATKAATTTNSAGAGLSDDGQRRAAAIGAGGPLGSADLAKPIVFECDYDYQPDEDARLTVKWFKDKEAEPFYQWLPELNVRHFADWIRPLVDQTFVADPHDPLKRFRSLLIRRLSMNLTGQYTCLVSSLANQDSRSGSLVVYQAPRSFTFEHRIFPAPASLVSAPPVGITPGQQHYIDQQQQQHYRQQQQQYPMHRAWPTPDEPPFMRPPPPSSSASSGAASPTQFKGLPNSAYPYQWPPVGLQQQQQPIRPPLVGPGGYPANHQHHNHQHHQQALPPAATIVRPANNNSQNQSLTQTTLNGEQEESAGPTTTTTKIVYTHDGRPIRRKLRRRRQLQAADDDLQSVGSIHQQQQQQQLQQAAQISSWQLKKKLGEFEPPFSTATIVPSLSSSNLTTSAGSISGGGQPPLYFQPQPAQTANYAIQLHYFQCQATQVTPRPVMALLVKRGADSIAQYLHESSLVAIRPYQVNQSDLFPPSSQAAPMTFGCGGPAPSPTGASNSTTSTSMGLSSPSRPLNGGESHSPQPMLVTLYDITVSATVALNVSLPMPIPANLQQQQQQARQRQPNQFNQINEAGLGPGQFGQQQPAAIGVNTILNYRRGQRMSFECHLELTGTEFETRKRIGISEEEVYQFAEAEEQRRRLRLQQLHELQLRQRQQQHGSQGGSSSSGLLLGFGPVGSSASEPANGSLRTHERVLFVVVILLVTLLQIALPLRAHNLNSSPPQLVLWHLA